MNWWPLDPRSSTSHRRWDWSAGFGPWCLALGPRNRPVLPRRPRHEAGDHLPLGAGMVKAAERAAEIGADVIQIFSDNPTAWRRRAAPPRELAAFGERLARLGIGPLAIHASYLVNLAGPEPGFHEKSV